MDRKERKRPLVVTWEVRKTIDEIRLPLGEEKKKGQRASMRKRGGESPAFQLSERVESRLIPRVGEAKSPRRDQIARKGDWVESPQTGRKLKKFSEEV